MSSFLLLVPLLLPGILASPLQPTFSLCESFYNPAPGISRFNVSNVYATLVSGERATQLGLPGNGVDVLRVDLIGNVGAELLGYDETTNKLGKSPVASIEVSKIDKIQQRYSAIPLSVVFQSTNQRHGSVIRSSQLCCPHPTYHPISPTVHSLLVHSA
jgi:hypothetical protein